MSLLPPGIGTLSVAEKYDLMDALWEDLETQTPMLTIEQSAELDRRTNSYAQDPSSVVPWEQVKADSFPR